MLLDARATKLLMRLPMRARVTVLLALAAAAFVGLAGACVSPTLPLPPPTAPTVSAGSSADMVKLTSQGGDQPNALIVVVNQNDERARSRRVAGTFADEQGNWQLEIHALPGDRLDVTQE